MNLNFFTAIFPYTTLEPIVENEFMYSETAFKKIRIFPHFFKSQDSFQRKVSSNTKIIDLKDFESCKLSLNYKVLIVKLLFTEFRLCPNKMFFIKNLRLWLAYLKAAAKKAKYLEDFNLLLPNSVNYSYWMNDWALVLAVLKERKTISNFVFRCGGFDIWDERHPGNYLPFRGLIYKYTDQVIPNSVISAEYIKTKTNQKHKVRHEYLGTIDFGSGFEEQSKLLTIVSCSSVIALKRIELIIEVLSKVQVKVKWLHFGDGEQIDSIKKLAKEKLQTHKVHFMGNVSNKDLMKFYSENYVDLFITTSSTEGLPVSVQEAISFGIPIIATNVGAMSEVVNDDCGILVDKDFSTHKVATIIEGWRLSKYSSLTQRQIIRAVWMEKFDAEKVYPQFINRIKATAK